MCPALMNFTCLKMVLIKCILLMNMVSSARVIYLYLSRVVVGVGENSPLMCGVFCLRVFTFRHPIFFPQIYSAPMTPSQFSVQFNI